MRIRIFFEKTEAMRFTGHLDLHKTWERTFRRSGLSLSYSHGFHPQPRLQLACALPLGFTSQAEILDAWLDQDYPIPEIQACLISAAPPGIVIQSVMEVEPQAPALQTQVVSAEYTIRLKRDIPDLQERIQKLISANHLPRVRKNKLYDFRPLIESIELATAENANQQIIRARLAAREGATGRPEELLDVLGIDLNQAFVQRSALFIEDAKAD